MKYLAAVPQPMHLSQKLFQLNRNIRKMYLLQKGTTTAHQVKCRNNFMLSSKLESIKRILESEEKLPAFQPKPATLQRQLRKLLQL